MQYFSCISELHRQTDVHEKNLLSDLTIRNDKCIAYIRQQGLLAYIYF